MLALLALAPRWLDTEIAGYALKSDPTVGVHDPKRGYFLVRTIECDGAIVTLTLTRDRNVVSGEGYAVPAFTPREGTPGNLKLVEKPLPSLATGKGVAIGASTDAVRARLGSPTRTKPHAAFLDYVYAWRQHATTHEQRYTFKAGRLIEIQFFRDASPE